MGFVDDMRVFHESLERDSAFQESIFFLILRTVSIVQVITV